MITWVKEALKINASDGAKIRTGHNLAVILSGPPPLFYFKFDSNLVTPSIENSICCISGKGVPGIMLVFSLVKTEAN